MIKPTLVILSDIHGNHQNDWLITYTQKLDSRFKIELLDVRELSEMETESKTKEEIHSAFVEGGIDVAVTNFIATVNKPAIVLGFSIGGVIAWKAALNGYPAMKILAVSSTRLRKEYQKPRCEVDLYFGDQDMNRPMDEWFEQMEIAPNILRGKSHDMYQEQLIAEKVSEDILQTIDSSF